MSLPVPPTIVAGFRRRCAERQVAISTGAKRPGMGSHTHRVKALAQRPSQPFTPTDFSAEQDILATVRVLRTGHPRKSGGSDRKH